MKLFRWAISSTAFILMMVAVMLFCGGAADALMLEMGLPQLATGADAVVEGTVVSQTSYWNAAHNNISTDVVISVSDNIKGSPAKGSRITITVPGGEVNGTRQWVSDVPGFSTGGKAIVFLKQAAEGKFKVHGLEQGKFAVETDVAGIEKVGALTVDKFKERVNLAVQGKPLPAMETTAPARDITLSSIQGKASSTVSNAPPAKDVVLSTISTVNPSTASAGTNTQVTITGSGFGGVKGTNSVQFYYKTVTQTGLTYTIEADAYPTWSDTQIVCTVPAYLVNDPEYGSYEGSASSGWVRTLIGGVWGTPYPFTVTFGNGPAKWPGTNPAVNYYVKPLAALPSSLAAVQAAAQTWTDDPANFTFSYAGSTASTAMAVNGKNEILWNLIGDPSIIGWASVTYGGGVVTECDIEFNTQFAWSTTGEAGKMDVQTIATHELGHWLFLRDLYGNRSGYPMDTAKVMYGRSALAQIKRILDPADSAGIRYIYGNGSTQKLIGADDATAVVSNGGGFIHFVRFVAASTGSVNEIRVKCTGAGSVKVGLYAGDVNSPTTLLNANNTSTGVVAGWNTISIASTPVTAGTYYWLAFNSSSNCVGARASSGEIILFRALSYAENLPSSAGTGLFSDSNWCSLIAGWGMTKLIGADDATAVVSNGGGFIHFVRFVAASTGSVNEIRVKCTGAGSVKVGLYAGDVNSPTTLLNANNTSTGVVAGWNTISVASTPVTAGTYYWLAFNSSSNCVGARASSGEIILFRALSYAENLPSSAGTGLFSDSNWCSLIAGWGTRSSTSAKLIGADDATAVVSNGGGFIHFVRFVAASTGSVNEIRVKCTGAGSVKVGLYAGDVNSPTTLLNANNTGTNVVAGWNTISIASTPVTAGTYYWLAFNSSSNCVGARASSGEIILFRALSYAENLPSSAGTGLFSDSNWCSLIAGWGMTKLIGADDATAVVSNGGGFIHFVRFVAASTGSVNEIRVKCTGAGSVKVGLYAGDVNSPTTLLNANNTSTGVVAGWNTISVASTPVTAGTYYWLAFNSSSNCVGARASSGEIILFRALSYAENLPSSAGTGLFSDSNWCSLIAGWGSP